LRDIGDARADLDDARNGRPDESDTATSPRRSTLIPWLVSAALLSAIIALLSSGVPRNQQAGERGPTLSRTVRLTNTPGREFGPAISPDGTWIAYYSDERGPTDILVKYLDSGGTLNLTKSLDLRLPSRTNLGGLAISPDGANLAFFGTQDPNESIYDTWVLPAPLGGFPRRLLQGMQGAQWSPDGKSLVCILPGSALGDALVVTDADGSNPRQLIRPAAGVHMHWPAWSADSRSIYFIRTYQPWNTEQSEIYRVPAAGGPPEPVVQTTRRAVYPLPQPGGDLIYSANPDSVDLGLWWRPGPSGEPRRLTAGVGEYGESSISRDGRRLVSMVTELRQSLVAVAVSAAATAASTTSGAAVARPLTDGYGGDLDPANDPTSDRMVFSSTRSGHRNLWIARQNGSDARPLTFDAANDHHPTFSPDGRQIAFVSDRGGYAGIWLVSAEGGAPRLLTKTVVLDSLAWSRDGAHILYSTPGTDRPAILSSVSVATGETRVFPTPGAAVAPAWSPAADAVAYLEPTMEAQSDPSAVPVSRMFLTIADTEGRSLHPELRTQRLSNGLVSWSPDGRRLAVVGVPANTPAPVWIVEPGAKAPFRKVMEFKPSIRPRGLTWATDGTHVIVAIQEAPSDLVLHEINR
jgi:Tol biopolymer transport system component